MSRMMGVCPDSLYPKVGYASLPTLVTTDNQVYTFGTTSAGFPTFPQGKGGIYASLNDIPDNPLRPGVDYMIEGNQIRMPNNTTWTGTLYWYGIAQPTDITALVDPILIPEGSRELIVLEAVRQFAQSFLQNAALADEMDNEIETKAWPTWCQTWKTQYRQGGALSIFTGRDLALLGSNNIGTGGW